MGIIVMETPKRNITPHKGGRTERINCRVTPKIKNMFLDLVKRCGLQQSDLLEQLIIEKHERSRKKA
jgi:hypothetical protein